MKVLDRYVTRELLIPILYLCVALIFLILIADLFDNLDELLRHHTPGSIILKYYTSLIPHAFTQIIPWATWLGTVFLLVNFGFHNETTAMKAAGLKITTIVRPILFLGFIIGIATFLMSDRIVPHSYRTGNEIKEIHIESNRENQEEKVFDNVTYHAKGNRLYFFRTFSKTKKEVQGVVVLWLDTESRNKRQKMVAQRGTWKDNLWTFFGVTEYQMDLRGRILGEPRTYEEMTYPDMTFTPEELAATSSDSTFLSYRELKSGISKLEENGVRVDSEIVDLQNRLASPWQGLIMMLISIPFLTRMTNRKVIAFQVLLCVALVFTYHVTGAVAIALGKAGKLYPFVSAWAANILFSFVTFFYLEKANY